MPTDSGIKYFPRSSTVLAMLPRGAVATAVGRATSAADVDLYQAQRASDLVAVPAFLTILDPTLLTADGWELLVDYHQQARDYLHKILLTRASQHQGNLPEPNLIGCPVDLNEPFLRFLMLRVRAAVARRRPLDQKRERQIIRLLWLIRLLDLGKTVRLSAVCSEFTVTPRTVQRDFELLTMARFPIESAGKGAYRSLAGAKSYHRYWPDCEPARGPTRDR